MLKFIVFMIIAVFNYSAYATNQINQFNQFNKCQNKTCIIVVDAGSSGSRLHVYAYELNKNLEAYNIEELYVNKINPGFASLTSAQKNINDYLDKLFFNISTENLPVYFYATAGMRALPVNQQLEHYDLLREWFKNKKLKLISARTITGSNEGVFDWLAVNYQNGSLISNNNITSNNITSGVMDIGGVSTQIAFSVYDQSKLDSTDLIQLEIYGRKYNLYVHSYMFIGVNEIFNQVKNNPYCFSVGYVLPNGELGQGDINKCEQDINLIIQNYQVSEKTKPIIQINNINNWTVMGAISSMVNAPPYSFDQDFFTPEQLLYQGEKKSCSILWDQLKNLYPNNNYLSSTCLNAAYYNALTSNYGINPYQKINYALTNNETDWTLGVILHRI